jgi:hypothetical protein
VEKSGKCEACGRFRQVHGAFEFLNCPQHTGLVPVDQRWQGCRGNPLGGATLWPRWRMGGAQEGSVWSAIQTAKFDGPPAQRIAELRLHSKFSR